MQISFSILVVCLNPGKKLEDTLESISGQTCSDYEVIVKDGLSTDGAVEALKPEPWLKVVRKRDRGIYDAMNQAVQEAKGDFLFFLNCGDRFRDERVLEHVRKSVQKQAYLKGELTGRELFYGDIQEELTGARVSSNPKIDAFACYRNVPCHQACFYGKALMKEKGFEESYRVRADYEHFLWCFFRGKAELYYLPLVIALYEGGGFSETKENRRRSRTEHKEITKQYMKPGERFRYRMILLLTLAPLRSMIAENPVTAGLYQKLKGVLYQRRKGG